MKRTKKSIAASAFGAIFALTCAAHAQSPSEIAAAKQWFAEGLKLEESGKWKEALERFKRASAVKKTPQIAFHVGLCEARSGALVEAMLDLDRAVSLARAAHATDVESAAQQEANDVRARAPTLEIDPAEGATATRVLLDGTEIASSTLHAPLPVDPGTHVVVVEFASGRVEKSVKLAEREAIKLPIAPPPPGAGAAASTAPREPEPGPSPNAYVPPPEKPSSNPTSKRTAPYVLLIGGGLVTIGGVVFFILRGNEIGALDDACPTRTGCDPALRSHESNGKLYSTVSAVLLSSGVIGMGVGAGVLLFGGKDDAAASARLVPSVVPGGSGGGASLVGRF